MNKCCEDFGEVRIENKKPCYCPCHKNGGEKCPMKKYGIFHESGKCDCYTKPAEDYEKPWEIRFVEKFYPWDGKTMPDEIKSFISQLLKEAEARGVEKGAVSRGIIEAEIKGVLIKGIAQARQDAFAEILEWAGKQMKELRESKLKTRYGNRDNAVRFNVLKCVQDFLKDKQKQND